MTTEANGKAKVFAFVGGRGDWYFCWLHRLFEMKSENLDERRIFTTILWCTVRQVSSSYERYSAPSGWTLRYLFSWRFIYTDRPIENEHQSSFHFQATVNGMISDAPVLFKSRVYEQTDLVKLWTIHCSTVAQPRFESSELIAEARPQPQPCKSTLPLPLRRDGCHSVFRARALAQKKRENFERLVLACIDADFCR